MVELDFQKGNGLIPTVVQDHGTGKVLMMAYINQASFEMTLRTGEAHYWSRSRNEIWHKGGTSGNIQKIREIYVDCDRDTLLFRVEQVGGAACHTGFETCFHNRLNPDGTMTTTGERMFDPEKVYKR